MKRNGLKEITVSLWPQLIVLGILDKMLENLREKFILCRSKWSCRWIESGFFGMYGKNGRLQ